MQVNLPAPSSSLPVSLEKRKHREREALHRWLLYATCGSAIAHILLLGISIKQNSLVVVPQAKLPESIDLTLITTAVEPELPKLTESAPTPTIAENTNSSAITEPVVAVNPVVSNVRTLPNRSNENTPKVDKVDSAKPTEQTANVESTKDSPQPTPKEQTVPSTSAANLPETTNQRTGDETNNLAKEGTAVSTANPTGITGFSDRIRNILRGNSSSNSSSSSSSPPTNSTLGTAEPAQPQKVQCIRCDKPEYPAEARNRGLQGQARVAVDVDANGNVTNVRIINSSGHAELDEAAVRQARQWKFTPSAAGRQGIGAKVDFQLEGSEYQQQRQRERQMEELARQENPKPVQPEVARQENPQPTKPAEVKPEPAREVARQEKPKPVQPEPIRQEKPKPAPIPEVARQELPPKPAVAPPPPEPIVPKPPAVAVPQPLEND